MPGRPWSKSEVQLLFERFREGVSIDEISKELGRTSEAVRKALKRRSKLCDVAERPASFVSIDEVAQIYDIKKRIVEEAGKIPDGKLIVESEFASIVAPFEKQRFYRCVKSCHDVFRQYRIKLRLTVGEGTWYWGNKKTIIRALEVKEL